MCQHTLAAALFGLILCSHLITLRSHVVENAGGAHGDVILGRVMFGGAVCKIFLCTFPVNVKLLLAVLIANPIKMHVHSFGPALNDSVGEDTDGAFVVKL